MMLPSMPFSPANWIELMMMLMLLLIKCKFRVDGADGDEDSEKTFSVGNFMEADYASKQIFCEVKFDGIC
jgi:hypothetical protein